MAAYKIQIPTKPYLKKYIETLYGDPLIFTEKNFFGLCVLSLLKRKFYFRKNEEMYLKKLGRLSAEIILHCPAWWLKQWHFPTDIPKENIFILNKLFEERFEEDLSRNCIVGSMCFKEQKYIIEIFCKLHNIEIDEDITMDALLKKEYRFRRKKFSGKSIAQSSDEDYDIVPGLKKEKPKKNIAQLSA